MIWHRDPAAFGWRSRAFLPNGELLAYDNGDWEVRLPGVVKSVAFGHEPDHEFAKARAIMVHDAITRKDMIDFNKLDKYFASSRIKPSELNQQLRNRHALLLHSSYTFNPLNDLMEIFRSLTDDERKTFLEVLAHGYHLNIHGCGRDESGKDGSCQCENDE